MSGADGQGACCAPAGTDVPSTAAARVADVVPRLGSPDTRNGAGPGRPAAHG